jgi:hypothetical protein
MMQTPEGDKGIMKTSKIKIKSGIIHKFFVWFDVTCSQLVIQVLVTRKV